MTSFVMRIYVPGTPTKSTTTPSGTPTNRLSPTNSGGEQLLPVLDKQFIVFCSEKVARVVALPSQNCVYKQIITEVSFVVKAEIIQMKGNHRLKFEHIVGGNFLVQIFEYSIK